MDHADQIRVVKWVWSDVSIVDATVSHLTKVVEIWPMPANAVTKYGEASA
jgi:hypothetical protein